MDTRGERLRIARKKHYKSGRMAAEALNIAPATYGAHERAETPGGRDFGPDEAKVYARRFKVSREWLLYGDVKSGGHIPEPVFEAEAPDESGPRMVSVIGHTGANATASFYVPAGELDKVPAPDEATDKTVAVEIRGHSLGKVLDRAIVFYDDVQRPITPALVGKLCVVGLADERVLVKRVRRGSKPGLYTLISEDDPIEDVEIEWAAPVIDIRPR
jgi:hypothetical protein